MTALTVIGSSGDSKTALPHTGACLPPDLYTICVLGREWQCGPAVKSGPASRAGFPPQAVQSLTRRLQRVPLRAIGVVAATTACAASIGPKSHDRGERAE